MRFEERHVCLSFAPTSKTIILVERQELVRITIERAQSDTWKRGDVVTGAKILIHQKKINTIL